MNSYDFAIIIVLYNDAIPNYVYKLTNCHLYIVDNTPGRDLKIIIPHVTYIALYENMGISYALNIGIRKAINDGALWAITMDQDSIIPDNMLYEYKKYLSKIQNIGILSPQLLMYVGEDKKVSDTYEEISLALTSGSLINLEAYKRVGGFRDELFIDEVDFEFCWNIRRHGYKIFQINSILMQHHLGETKEYKVLGKHLFYITNHSSLRRYYMVRNRLYVHELYPEFRPSTGLSICTWAIMIIKILLFEENRYSKMKAIYMGYKDFHIRQMGKCCHKF